MESSSGPAGRLELPAGHTRFINGTVNVCNRGHVQMVCLRVML